MLSLREIVKNYVSGDTVVSALQGVSIDFRENEFVSILGPSGCGKTTLLNVIGGLDRYDSGDLVINGRSTKEYDNADWDTYRNHSIGFVFQSYNLISHQTVLANVELALTLSGVSREERRRRAIDALTQVGLGDQIHKKPNQMSGGQMQRVAIARALVNDPDILLADEPTGALDTATSVQIMEIIKKIAEKKLVIMVTHNPELAEQYSTRIIKLRDGQVIDDTDPYTPEVANSAATGEENGDVEVLKKPKKRAKKAKKNADGKGKRSMSFLTALSLSLNNLMTKKTRTLLVSVAGSIGIIGIALILALSNGVNLFIAGVQEDTLSTYPLTIQKETQDMSAMLSAMMASDSGTDYSDTNMVHVDDSLGTMMSAMSSTVSNNLEAFKAYIEAHEDELDGYVSDIQYTYDYDLQVFNMVAVDKDGKTVVEAREIGMDVVFDHMGSAFSGMSELMSMSGSMGMNVFSEMIDNQKLLDQQYDVIAGSWPTKYDEVVLVVSSNNQISKMTMYMLGMLDPADIEQELADLMAGNYEASEDITYTFDELLGTKFMLLTTADFYTETDRTYTTADGDKFVWADVRDGFDYDAADYVAKYGKELKISGIIRPKTGVAATSISGAIGYTKDLTDYILKKNAESVVINQQKNYPTVNVLTGLPFERTHYTPETIDQLVDKIDEATMDMFYAYMTQQILNNPDFSDRIQVNDTESFYGMFMLLPEDKRATIFEAILTAAASDPANETGLQTLCAMLSTTTGGITITPENFVKLLPVLDLQKQVLGALNGIPAMPPMVPAAIPGLIEMAGETTMQAIYTQLSESIKTMTVNKEIFVALLATMQADDPAFIQLEETLYSMAPQIDATLESVLDVLDDAEAAKPASINFYAVDFESKDKITAFIADYNDGVEEKDQMKYTDVVGIMMSSVTVIVDAISYVLIAFVSISLVVSSIMIGIITYISVLERTKEIGILRAIGASKRDISRVFNAETVIIGFAAGAIGILATVLFCIPINLILRAVTDMNNIKAVLPVAAAFILIAISMILTLIAGLIPSRIASKKDPVVALRTE